MSVRAEAVEACRQWARIRERVLVYFTEDDGTDFQAERNLQVEEFDKQMFRLGEQAWGRGGEVAEVQPRA